MRSSQAFLGSNPSSFIFHFSFYSFLFLPLFRPQGVLGLTQVPCSCSQNCLGTPRLHSSCQRPYRVECTGSLPNSEVKRRRARSVPGWGTAREALRVLLAFSFTLHHVLPSFLPRTGTHDARARGVPSTSNAYGSAHTILDATAMLWAIHDSRSRRCTPPTTARHAPPFPEKTPVERYTV